ncbi:hypothetical protein Ae201684_008065 [Aphanomyces euteiches]|uniref:DDE-1 domain-containing protein n=1 Tax=Aphanomyces euteiches TaxID=100861 RepID=A0A6G0X6E1_9STRA|nr:hypothetical protein Ae201684_008065 [Aphanomyces euteiches]KAH9135154.1 hypothetical protein AeRB84_019319 [Aphanomyces euteiches]
MFLCAVARPRYDESTGRWFDSKIGISSFVETVPADRTSRNRPAGTIETKSVAVTKAVYREYVINKVLPAVRSKWPVSMRKMPIFLQHDNASAHGVFDEAFQAQCNVDGFSICLQFQPPNSPDLNVLDLGFFRAIQTLQFEKEATNIDEMLRAVDEAFLEVDITTLENVFLTLQSVMISVLEVRGYNNYKMPHLGKAKQRRVGQLPVSLPVSRGLVAMCVEEIEEYDMQSQFESLTL